MKNRVALVTGGTGGIGTAICRRLADLGAKTVIASDILDDDKLQAWTETQKSEGYANIVAMRGDVTDFAACEQLITNITEQFGSMDVLINNAGITKDGVFKKMTPEQWSTLMRVNLDSVFNVTRAAINGMLDRNYGRIINMSSVNGHKGQFGQANYAAAKSAIYGFTKSLALECAKKGITVNSVSPGYIGTPMVMAIAEEVRQKIVDQIPVGRLGTPEEIARIVGFLAEEASSFITGADFSINGGLYMH